MPAPPALNRRDLFRLGAFTADKAGGPLIEEVRFVYRRRVRLPPLKPSG